MQKHVKDHKEGNKDVLQSLEQSFYVDNCLEGFPTATAARQFINKVWRVLMEGGFEIRQWVSNEPSTGT